VEKPEPTRRTPSLAADKKNTVRAAAPTVEETLRVSVSLLDELINNAGELVLARNQLLRAAAMVGGQFPDLPPLVQNLDAITSRVQEKVMQVRMQPLSVVFNKFPRIVRDLARKLDKKIVSRHPGNGLRQVSRKPARQSFPLIMKAAWSILHCRMTVPGSTMTGFA